MTYHVQNILRTSLFLATKAEGMHESVETFAANSGRNVSSESVLAAEYLVMQALRYNLDVRHPFRALKGGHLELIQLAHGKYEMPTPSGETAAQLRDRMLALPSPTATTSKPSQKMTPKQLEDRINAAYGATSATLKSAALFTDSYFLYTPSQIWLSALLLADKPLTTFYLSLKLPSSHPSHQKLLSTLTSCATLLSSHRTHTVLSLAPEQAQQVEATHKARTLQLINKLKNCRDPDKIDLVQLNASQKRDAIQQGSLEESKAKRRKLAREGYEKEADAFWGPELGAGKREVEDK